MYDSNGNLYKEISGGEVAKEYSYTTEDRLRAVLDGNQLLLGALYDGDGNRVFTLDGSQHYVGIKHTGDNQEGTKHDDCDHKQKGTTGEIYFPYKATDVAADKYDLREYVNDTNQQYTEVLQEYTTKKGELDTSYTYGMQRESMANTSGISYYMYDGRGSVSNIYGQKQAGMVSYTYGDFGAATASNKTSNTYDYNAEATDALIGMQYLRARYYSPTLTRFISQDTYEGKLTDPLSLNRYAYVANNPVNYVDPSGHLWKEIFAFGGAVGGAIIGLAVGGPVGAVAGGIAGYNAGYSYGSSLDNKAQQPAQQLQPTTSVGTVTSGGGNKGSIPTVPYGPTIPKTNPTIKERLNQVQYATPSCDNREPINPVVFIYNFWIGDDLNAAITDPSALNIGLLALDLVPGIGEGKAGVKGVEKAGEALLDLAKGVNKVDTVIDVGKTFKLVDGMTVKTSEALDDAAKWLGDGYKDMGNGRFLSADGTKQVRMGDADISGAHGGGAHMNFEELTKDPITGKMQVTQNYHVYLSD